MAYRKDTELEQGLELLGSLDNFGQGVPVEELFPELMEEAAVTGIDLKEYKERTKSMGSLKCIDDLDPDNISPEFIYGENESEEDLLQRLNAEDYTPVSFIALLGTLPPRARKKFANPKKLKVRQVFTPRAKSYKENMIHIYRAPCGSVVCL